MGQGRLGEQTQDQAQSLHQRACLDTSQSKLAESVLENALYKKVGSKVAKELLRQCSLEDLLYKRQILGPRHILPLINKSDSSPLLAQLEPPAPRIPDNKPIGLWFAPARLPEDVAKKVRVEKAAVLLCAAFLIALGLTLV